MFTSVLFFVIIMLLLIVPGFVLRKLKLIGDGAITSLINIMLYVCAPLLIFKSLSYSTESGIEPLQGDFLFGLGVTFLLAILSMVPIFFVSKLIFKKCGNVKRESAYTFASVFGNVGFIGIPFLEYILTGNSILPYALVYATIYNVAFQILCWTVGIYIMTGDIKSLNIKKILLNPVMIVTFVGLPLYLLKVDLSLYIAPFVDAVSYLGSMTTPLSLIIVGVRLADVKLKSIFQDGYGYVSSALRLIVSPLLSFGIVMALKAMGVFGIAGEEFYETVGRAVCMVVVILSALPAATSTIAFCEKFGGDGEAGINAFINSTVITLITLPLLIPFLCSFF